ncbi:MAG: ATP-binding cassette domain-containing protein [Gammaproteobacteria bacterium]
MSLLTLTDISLAYGHQPLLQNVNFSIDRGERVCLVGRNGTGKSTLFRVISGMAAADTGEVWHRDTLRISYLLQDIPPETEETVYQVVASGLGTPGRLLAEYHQAVNSLPEENDSTDLKRLNELQQQIDVENGWNIDHKVEAVLSRLSLPPDQPLATCSGGIRRRVMLARALVSDPDLLLLDEPTNHMDIASIHWLEEFLLAFTGALMFISHDRTLVRNLSTRIIELDRGILTSFPGNYEKFLEKKDELLAAEEKANARFDRKLAEEEAWIRKGIKARRTRNEGRVRKLEQMRREKQQRMERSGAVNLSVNDDMASGKLVADLRHVSFSYGDHCIVRDFSTRLMRGDRVGIIGPNGSGKSTLLKLLLGEIKPDSGEVIHGTRLQIAYFDQQRARLQPGKTVRENISEGSDYVTVRGRSRHVIGYMKDFLFPPERIDSPVKSLSGGERNRLLLARIFTQPANMLVLDEPTNDLDVETMELLEDLLMDFDGTLLLVSHDRTFLDNVVTSTIAFEGGGCVREYVGGYEDWLRQRPVDTHKKARQDNPGPGTEKNPASRGKTKLSYHEQRELVDLPDRIEELEQEQTALEKQISDSEFYKQDKAAITETLSELERIRRDLEQAYERWEELE